MRKLRGRKIGINDIFHTPTLAGTSTSSNNTMLWGNPPGIILEHYLLASGNWKTAGTKASYLLSLLSKISITMALLAHEKLQLPTASTSLTGDLNGEFVEGGGNVWSSNTVVVVALMMLEVVCFRPVKNEIVIVVEVMVAWEWQKNFMLELGRDF